MPLCSRTLMAARFVYPLKDLERDPIEIHEPLPDSWLEQALADTEVQATPNTVGRLDATLTMTGRDVVVQGAVQASVSLPCARCLQPTPIEVDGELGLLLVPGKPPAPSPGVEQAKGRRSKKKRAKEDDDEGHVIDPREAELDTYSGDEVVLDPFIREAILLELPIFPLCSDACPGIGAASSETTSDEDAVDPRLAPLLELKKKNRV